jgi:hypothetical protein
MSAMTGAYARRTPMDVGPKLYETLTAETWWPGRRARRQGGEHCLFEWVVGRYGRGVDECDRVRAAIKVLFPERAPTGGLVEFNDHPATTLEDILWVCHVADV